MISSFAFADGNPAKQTTSSKLHCKYQVFSPATNQNPGKELAVENFEVHLEKDEPDGTDTGWQGQLKAKTQFDSDITISAFVSESKLDFISVTNTKLAMSAETSNPGPFSKVVLVVRNGSFIKHQLGCELL